MAIRDNFLRVLDGYSAATSEAFADHPIAELIRKILPSEIRWHFPDDSLLLIKGSAGQGAWARGPWVAIFDRLVTDSAQRGFYPVYLFPEDLSGVYLSLNQGMTDVRKNYRADAKTTLRARAENFRAMLGSQLNPFNISPIDLAPRSPTNDTSYYEAGNICSIRYDHDQIPSEEVLINHLSRALQLYRFLIDAGAADEQGKAEELEIFSEGGDPPRVHLRVERNRKLAAKVKRLKGPRCEACQMAFSERYGVLGEGFIEAHHRVPFAQLKHRAIPLDPRTDFAVLCSNCHRMAHRMDDPSDIESLRSIVEAHREA